MCQGPAPLHPPLKSSKSVSLTAYSSTLVMDAARIPETSPHFYQSSWCGNPVHIRLCVYSREKLRPQLDGSAVREKCCRRRRFNSNLWVYMFIKLPGGKGGRCVGLTTLPLSCADCLLHLEASTSWNPQGLSRHVMGLLYLFMCISNFIVLFKLLYNSYRCQ
jgi:hypothetical protein